MYLKYAVIGSLSIYGGLYYSFPLLRKDTQQLILAGKRFLSVSFGAFRIGVSYIGGITKEKHIKNSEIFFEYLKHNGGLYVKLGQILAMMDLVIPEEYAERMKPLLNESTVSDYSSIKSVIEEDLQSPIESIFSEFDPVPIASASIAQVHRATLKTGEKVAVKVQHKWVKEQFPGDLRMIEVLAKIAKGLFSDFDLMWIIDDLKKAIPAELNFVQEADNCERCFEMFKSNRYVKVPKVFRSISTDRVLVMDFMSGVRICDIDKIKELQVDLSEVAHVLSKTFNEMIFVHGFIHCDPHPGNIFVNAVKEGNKMKPQIILLDHGLYRKLSVEKKNSYKGMWRSILNRDEESMKVHAAELGVYALYPLLAGMMVGRTWDDIMDDSSGLERLKNVRVSQGDKETMKMHAQEWRVEINQVLSRMDNEIVLLFKVFEWLRANDAALGAPINTIEIMAEYLNRDESFGTKLWMNIKLWWVKKFW